MVFPTKIKNLFRSRANQRIDVYLVFRAADTFFEAYAKALPTLTKPFAAYCLDSVAPLEGQLTTDNGLELVYYATSRKEATTAIDRCLFLENFKHFESWTYLRSESPTFNSPAWEAYKTDVLSPQVESSPITYFALRVVLSAANIASFLRHTGNISPLVLPGEDPSELSAHICYLTRTDTSDRAPGELTTPKNLRPLIGIDPQVTTAMSEALAEARKILTEKGELTKPTQPTTEETPTKPKKPRAPRKKKEPKPTPEEAQQ